MKENMTRQATCINAALVEIVEFFNTIPPGPLTTEEFCALLDTEVVEEGAFLDALADCIETTFLGEAGVGLPFGFLAQIERLVCIIRLLADRIRAVACPTDERFIDLVYEILCVFVEAAAILVGILVKLEVLDGTFLVDNATFFECLVCSLIGEITALEEAVRELSCLIVALLSADVTECTPCYVASTPGRRPRVNVNTKNICNDKNGCSCKK